MSLKIQKYIETSLDNKESLYNAEVINFPAEKKANNNKVLKNNYTWKLYDKTNLEEDGDQLKAVIGICFMLSVLVLVGLYSNL